MTATNYAETKLLNHALGNTAWTMPTALYMALHTADPGDVGTASEVVGGSYAPQLIDFATTAGASCVSAADVNFASMPAVTVTHFSIRENTSGGSALFVGPLSTPQTTTAGQTLTFPAGQVSVTAD